MIEKMCKMSQIGKKKKREKRDNPLCTELQKQQSENKMKSG